MTIREARFPERVTLHGRVVDVVPLNADAHAEALWAGVQDDGLWTYMADGPFADPSAFKESLRTKANRVDQVFYAVVDKTTGDAVGLASYLRIDLPNRVVEVGNIVYTVRLQRTAGGTEAMYLMARYAFEELGYRRYEWKCNALNEPSRRAALRYGFQFEGVFRQHMVVKGRNRDTAWFAMLDGDWPERKRAFEEWLGAENFDEDGQQRRALPHGPTSPQAVTS